ncbi:MAG: hypothetical protein ACRDRA_14015 [Pseudonocardiaceae bacterium]
MTQGESSELPTLFQGRVSVSRDLVRALDELDIDVIPGTGQVDETHSSFEALLRLDQVEALVAAGASVTLKRTVGRRLPVEQFVAQADPLERLRPLEQFREDGGQ